MKKAAKQPTEFHGKLLSTRFNEKYGIERPELFWLFFFGSLLGVLMEGVYCKFVRRVGDPRRFHLGTVLHPLRHRCGGVLRRERRLGGQKKWQKFLLFGCLGSGLEVIAGAILEFGLGMYAWDYSGQFMNFRGYVSLGMTAAWGAIGLLFSFAVPYVDGAYAFMQTHAWHIAYVILSVFLTIDLAFTALCLVRWAERRYDIPPLTKFEQFIDEKYDDVFMQNRFIEWHPIEWKHPDA